MEHGIYFGKWHHTTSDCGDYSHHYLSALVVQRQSLACASSPSPVVQRQYNECCVDKSESLIRIKWLPTLVKKISNKSCINLRIASLFSVTFLTNTYHFILGTLMEDAINWTSVTRVFQFWSTQHPSLAGSWDMTTLIALSLPLYKGKVRISPKCMVFYPERFGGKKS